MSAFTHALSTNNYGPFKFIVSSSAANGTHTTIASALSAASSGDTIYIRAGSYTENLTLVAGVNLSSIDGDAITPNVTIIGNATATFTGTCSISGIRLQTNSAALLTVSGSNATIVNLVNCYLNCTNNTGITHSSSSASSLINIMYCFGNIGTTGISLFTSTSSGDIRFYFTEILNTGVSTTASTISTGLCRLEYTTLQFPLTTSSAGSIFGIQSGILTTLQNATSITLAGTGTSTFDNCEIQGGTASAASVGSGTTLVLNDSIVNSSNTNAVTGAGSLAFGNVNFSGTSSVMNVTTQTGKYSNLAQYKATTQPRFSAYLASVATDKTGDGTTYQLGTDALTEIFDIGSNFNTNGTFTAPVSGYYHFCYGVLGQQGVSTMTAEINLNVTGTSAMIYRFGNYGTIGTGNWPMSDSRIVFMTASDTAVVNVIFSNGTKVVDIFGGSNDPRTYFSGTLIG